MPPWIQKLGDRWGKTIWALERDGSGVDWTFIEDMVDVSEVSSLEGMDLILLQFLQPRDRTAEERYMAARGVFGTWVKCGVRRV